MRLSLSLTALALLFVGPRAGDVLAGEAPDPAAPDPVVEARLAKLSSPPAPREVADLVRLPSVKEAPSAALRVVAVLWHAGGYAAAKGLRTLSTHDDASVRVAALTGVAHVGLRVAEGTDAVRRALSSRSLDERIAAFEAIGRVGDAQDVPDLVAALGECEACPRQAAYRALSALSGERLPAVPGRWQAWWQESQREMLPRIDAALDAISLQGTATSGGERTVAPARALVLKEGWRAVDRVVEVARAFLRASDPALRIEGYRLAKGLRLGDLAEEVESAFKYERHPEAFDEGALAATALGVPTANAKRPDSYVPDVRAK